MPYLLVLDAVLGPVLHQQLVDAIVLIHQRQMQGRIAIFVLHLVQQGKVRPLQALAEIIERYVDVGILVEDQLKHVGNVFSSSSQEVQDRISIVVLDR